MYIHVKAPNTSDSWELTDPSLVQTPGYSQILPWVCVRELAKPSSGLCVNADRMQKKQEPQLSPGCSQPESALFLPELYTLKVLRFWVVWSVIGAATAPDPGFSIHMSAVSSFPNHPSQVSGTKPCWRRQCWSCTVKEAKRFLCSL